MTTTVAATDLELHLGANSPRESKLAPINKGPMTPPKEKLMSA